MTGERRDATRVLVAGWFSFPDGHATAGDLLARDVVCEWLADWDVAFDVAVARPFRGGVDPMRVRAADYSHVVFVCGPFGRGELEAKLLERFASCRLIGLDLSMSEPVEAWNPFDLLLERDSSRAARPDLVFLSRRERVPVVGVCLVEPHPGAWTDQAHGAIRRLLARRRAAIVRIDTRLDVNATGLRDPAEVEALIARMDLVVTTRLHGMVLALKNGVPVIAIDPVPGGAKIRRHAATIGWPVMLQVDGLTDDALQRAFEYCCTNAARAEARSCAERALRGLSDVRRSVRDALLGDGGIEAAYRARLAEAAEQSAPAEAASPGRPVRDLAARVLGRIVPRRLRAWLGGTHAAGQDVPWRAPGGLP